jgi:predicted peroxiredoxin
MSQSSADYGLQIIITHGTDSPSKAILGLAMALSAVASDTRVVVFFTMKGAQWVDPNVGEFKPEPNFNSSEEYIEALLDSGVTMEGCTSCVEQYCPHLRNADGHYQMREGVIFNGLSTATIRATSIPTLIF